MGCAPSLALTDPPAFLLHRLALNSTATRLLLALPPPHRAHFSSFLATSPAYALHAQSLPLADALASVWAALRAAVQQRHAAAAARADLSSLPDTPLDAAALFAPIELALARFREGATPAASAALDSAVERVREEARWVRDYCFTAANAAAPLGAAMDTLVRMLALLPFARFLSSPHCARLLAGLRAVGRAPLQLSCAAVASASPSAQASLRAPLPTWTGRQVAAQVAAAAAADAELRASRLAPPPALRLQRRRSASVAAAGAREEPAGRPVSSSLRGHGKALGCEGDSADNSGSADGNVGRAASDICASKPLTGGACSAPVPPHAPWEAAAAARRAAWLAELQSAADTLPCMITVADMLAPEAIIIYCNAAFCAATGYTCAETQGRNCRFLQGAGTAAEARARLRAAIAAGAPCHCALLNYRKDGSAFRNFFTLRPVWEALPAGAEAAAAAAAGGALVLAGEAGAPPRRLVFYVGVQFIADKLELQERPLRILELEAVLLTLPSGGLLLE